MKIHLFVRREHDSVETIYWIADAVDEWTVDSNPEAISDIEKEKDDGDGRWLVVEVPDDALERPWREAVVKGTVVPTPEDNTQ